MIGFVLAHRADAAFFFPNGQFERLVESLEARFVVFQEGAKLVRNDCRDLCNVAITAACSSRCSLYAT